MLLVLAVVEIGLSKDTYAVREDKNFIEVCVEVLNGTLQRSVVVTLTTNPHSATGMLLKYFLSKKMN